MIVPGSGEATERRHNLPGGLSTFVGREQEQAEVTKVLDRVRLLTLTGSGGCGKTRLALRVAAEKLDNYPDGVWWVELARLEQAELLVTTINEVVGVSEGPGGKPLEGLVAHFREKHALILLDNCEHLLTPCAAVVDALLHECSKLTILATSRAPLALPVETAWRVPSMSLPPEDSEHPGQNINASDAVRLFVERAVQMRPNFRLTESNEPSVAAICRSLDGIPLAIELAAARVRVVTPQQIAQALGDRFRLLSRDSGAVVPRHRTLLASIDWSHDLLTREEQVLLRRLSIFSAGWTLDAAEQVCSGGAIDTYAVLDLLTALVDKSLVNTEERGPEVRYSLLETVRQYALQRLHDDGEMSELRSRHLDYYLTVAEASEPGVLGAAKDDPVMTRLNDELPNLRSALDSAAEIDPDAGLRIVGSLTLFWLFTGRFREGDAAYARALDSSSEQPTPQRGRALAGRAHLAQHAGTPEKAHDWAVEALRVGEECGDRRTQARALNTLGRAALLADSSNARALLERSLENAIRADDDWCMASTTQALSLSFTFQEEYDSGRTLLQRSYETADRLGYRRGVAISLWCMGWERLFCGRLGEAASLFDRSVQASDEVGDPFPRGAANSFQVYLRYMRGDLDAAYALAADNVERMEKVGAGLAFGFAVQELGRTEMVLGAPSQAREHLDRAIDVDRRFAWAKSWHYEVLGTLNRLEGLLGDAIGCGREAADLARNIGSPWMLAGAEVLIARVVLAKEQVRDAERLAHHALDLLVDKRLLLKVPECLDLLALVAQRQERFAEAARLLGGVASARQRLGIVRMPSEGEFWSGVERSISEALGSDLYGDVYAAGARMDIDETVAYVRRARGERKRPSRGWDSLTPTELTVVRHVAEGLTNPQIGERMFISRGTVKVHLEHIFSKLNVSSRSQLAAEVARHEIGRREGSIADWAAESGRTISSVE